LRQDEGKGQTDTAAGLIFSAHEFSLSQEAHLHSVAAEEKLPVPQKMPCGQRQRLLNKRAVSDRGVRCQKLWSHPKFSLGHFSHSALVFGKVLHCAEGVVRVRRVVQIPRPTYVFVRRHAGSRRCKGNSPVEMLGKFSISRITEEPEELLAASAGFPIDAGSGISKMRFLRTVRNCLDVAWNVLAS